MAYKNRAATQRVAERTDLVEPGLHLVLGEGGKILRSAPIRNAPRRFLPRPSSGPKTSKQVTATFSELVLEVLRRDGRVLDSFAWPWTPDVFFDQPLPKRLAREATRVGRIASSAPSVGRLLRVPVAADATFLLFSRSEVEFGRGNRPRAVRRSGLTLYSLVSPIPSPPPRLPIPGRELTPQPLPFRTRLDRTR